MWQYILFYLNEANAIGISIFEKTESIDLK